MNALCVTCDSAQYSERVCTTAVSPGYIEYLLVARWRILLWLSQNRFWLNGFVPVLGSEFFWYIC